MPRHFRGNSALKGRDVAVEWTPEIIREYIRCKDDIIYFIETYFKIVTGKGLQPMVLRDYQREMILSMQNNRFTQAVMSRQAGKSECFRAFVLHYILFGEYKTVAIVANKEAIAIEILGKIQTSFLNLPSWLQQGVVDFNKKMFVLENNSRAFAAATSKDALRGFTVNMLIIDEAAHIENWDEFYGAVSPTITSDDSLKMVMVSTPNGLNHFYDFFEGSSLKKNINGFYSLFVPWWVVPGRDEEWKQETLKLLNWDYIKFDQEFNCSFIGSSGTLISGSRLEILKKGIKAPLHEINSLKIYVGPVKEKKEWKSQDQLMTNPQLSIYEKPNNYIRNKLIEVTIPPEKYAIVADVSRGKGLDYSAFSVFNIERSPFIQVATFRRNDITPSDYAKEIYKIAQLYNNAAILIEINDIGEQVSSILMDDLEYDNVLCTQSNGRAGKTISFNLAKSDKGVKTTLPLKNSGCLLLKLLVEEGKLLIWDEDTINELLTFSKDKNTYKAEMNKHDDLVMTLVLFAWLSDQKYFLEWTSIRTISDISSRSIQDIEKNLLNFGYVARGNQYEGVGRTRQGYDPVYNQNLPFSPFEPRRNPLDPFQDMEVLVLPNF